MTEAQEQSMTQPQQKLGHRGVTLTVALLAPILPSVLLAVLFTWVIPVHISTEQLTDTSKFVTTLLAAWVLGTLILLYIRDDRLYQKLWSERVAERPNYDYSQLWTGSPEFGTYRRRRFLSWICLASALALAASAVGVATGELTPESRRVGFAIVLAAVAALLTIEAAMPYASARRAFLERLQFEKSAEVQKTLSRMQKVEFSTVFDLNRKQLDEYHVLTIRHAQTSFRNAQIASGIGFLLLVAGVSLALNAPDTSARIAVSALAGVATLLSGYVSKVFFTSNQHAMRDLGNYYRQPLEASRLLAAERLVREPELLKDPAGALVALMVSHLLGEPPGLSPADGNANGVTPGKSGGSGPVDGPGSSPARTDRVGLRARRAH